MIRGKIKQEIEKIVKDLGLGEVEFVVEHPEDMDHGDYACNVAMIGWKHYQGSERHESSEPLKNPKELAENIVEQLGETDLKNMASKINVAGPGFINISIRSEVIGKQIDKLLSEGVEAKVKWGKEVMVEYAHPNTHKEFHIGHLRNISLGVSIARLLETVGVKVVRANYQGDVGLHIAKAIWGIKSMSKDYKLAQKASVFDRVKFLGVAYSTGAKAYEEDEKAKEEIIEFNKQIFEGEGEITKLWKETRQWSLDYFDVIYKRVGTKYDRFFFESECTNGLEIAKEALAKGILKKSQGAVVFDGTKYGLDTRVFINSKGLPTYEAKELGLAPKQLREYPNLDKIIHVVGPEQKSFFEVTFKVEELLDPKLFKGKQYHRVYEFVDLKDGKMSSRKGQVVTGWWLLDEAKERILKAYKVDEETADKIAVGAVKYAFLKIRPLGRIAFDMEESVSLEGNSGPYLQYTYARCQSVLKKARGEFKVPNLEDISKEEDVVLRTLYRYEEVVIEAAEELSPNLVCNFLYDLAQKYNSFYNKCQILNAESEDQKQFRLWLTYSTGEIIKRGLDVLGIQTPEKM
jgi:arginyl-tRNA synthetase